MERSPWVGKEVICVKCVIKIILEVKDLGWIICPHCKEKLGYADPRTGEIRKDNSDYLLSKK